MDKYLIEILKEVNTIIIPELGALTIVNHATGEIMFMPYLKFDDGKLSKHIAERESWEENEAKNLIARYVREVRTKLDQGETYDIYKVGSFFKNEEGDVDFRAWEADNTDSDTTIEPGIAETPIVEAAPEPEPEAVKETNEQEMNIPPVEPASIVTEQEAPTEEQAPEPTGAEETPLETQPSSEPKTIPEEEQWKDDLDVPPVNYQKETPKKPILEKAEKDKKKKKRGAGFYILLAVLVLLIGGGTYFGINYNELKQYVPFLADKEKVTEGPEASDEQSEQEEAMSETEEPEEAQEPAEETETIEDNTKEQPAEPAPIPVVSSSGLHVDKSLPIQVIVGSFAEESNANGLVEQFKSNGQSAAIVGQYDLLYFVSIASFENMESFNASKSVVNGVSQKYWIFRK